MYYNRASNGIEYTIPGIHSVIIAITKTIRLKTMPNFENKICERQKKNIAKPIILWTRVIQMVKAVPPVK